MEASPFLLINSVLLTFGITAVLVMFLKPIAVRVGLVDAPDARKDHAGHIPLVGGLAIFSGFGLSCALLSPQLLLLDYFFAASAILIVVGVVDDFIELSARARFGAQIAASLVMVLGGHIMLYDFGALSWDGSLFTLGVFVIPLTVFSTVGVINAVNMSDGVDGLAGSYALVALIGLSIVSFIANHDAQGAALVLLAAGLLAFLAFNYRVPGRRRATVFLGDSGSTFLGFALTWFIIASCQGEDRIMTPVTALWFLMLPLFDTVGIMLRRIIKGRSPFAADREHFHHVLQRAGFSVNESLAVLLTLALTGMAAGLAGLYYQVPEMCLFITFLLLFSLYFLGMMHAWKVMRFLRWSICLRKTAQGRRSSDRISSFDRWGDTQAAAVATDGPGGTTAMAYGNSSDRRSHCDRRVRPTPAH
ncbi:MAG: UDP-GlcNAc:undecaprenyl-phosphate GlcNAc-1-phosphate transferase [Gammaproteobacteria bacterium]|nr:MAG: UDP-GlcNAc:undecaprenyl-phosphate GlcNAc-1-phosphate transferase [Gammaproteobacteria bacterium]TND07315.1 MAG: UDP-GlcNAc:undecaprenyl-phosphate GlcNAc-1-phosphate transferase [Gammaproteobacteria bacterium]